MCAFPGALDEIAFAQLREGRTWEISDRAAPAMAALWGLAEQLVLGPFVLLLLQSVLVLVGCYGLLRRALSPYAAAIVASVILLMPPVLAATMLIDGGRVMAGLLAVGTLGLLHGSVRVRVLGLVACALAVAFRLEAIAATLPLVVLLFDAGRRGVARYALAFAAWLAVSGAGLAIDAGLTRHEVDASYELALDEADPEAELPFVAHDVAKYHQFREVGLGTGSSRLQDYVRDGMRFLGRNTALFRPFVFVVLSLLLLPFCRRQHDICALLASGIALGLVVLPGPPSVWPVICACLAVPMLVARRRLP